MGSSTWRRLLEMCRDRFGVPILKGADEFAQGASFKFVCDEIDELRREILAAKAEKLYQTTDLRGSRIENDRK